MTDRRATPRSTPDRRRAAWSGPRERRAGPRRAPMRIGTVTVEALDFRAAAAQRAEWAALAARALEPNPFFEPAFILPALHRLPKARRPFMLVVRAHVGARTRMIGLLPIASTGPRLALGPLRAWRHPLAPLGAPLLDHDHAAEAFAGMLAFASAASKAGAGLVLSAIDRDGAIAALVARQVADRRATTRVLDARTCPALLAASSSALEIATDESLSFVLHEGEPVLDALERHFALEAAGSPTSFGPDILETARAFTFALALEGRCVIGELRRDGALAASGVAALAGDIALVWRVARDAAEAPDAPLAALFAQALIDRPRVARVLCCAPGVQESPPPDRIHLDDRIVASIRDPLREEARRRAREGAAKLFRRLTGRNLG